MVRINQSNKKLEKRLLSFVILVVVSTFVINMLSSYIRHFEAGVGCAPWPECYAQVGDLINSVDSNSAITHALTPGLWIKRTHRTVATVLVLFLVLVLHHGLKTKRLPGWTKTIPFMMAGVVLLLSIIGPASYLKHYPIVATLNLLGGLLLLALGWRLWLQLFSPEQERVSVQRKRIIQISFLVLLIQLVLGAWLSANFSASSCIGLFDCQGDPVNYTKIVADGESIFWPFRTLELDQSGRILMESGMQILQLIHQSFAFIAGLLILIAGIMCCRQKSTYQMTAAIMVVLMILQISLGIAGLSWEFPLILVLLHNAVAALLLLASIRLNYLTPTS